MARPPWELSPRLHSKIGLDLEHVQISFIAQNDLDMTLCVFLRFLKFHRVLGTKP